MPPDWDQELEDLLTRAVEAVERDDHAEVERLLATQPSSAPVIRSHLRQLSNFRFEAPTETERPKHIGAYAILDVLGSGGMGTVYLAEQREPIQRRVALKVIKLGMDTRAVLARFQAERQALAMMSHDCIAKVFDAGSTERGQPFFAMEHVPGMPLTEHCDMHKLSIEERLRLFQKVCAGVQHAHQKGVVHRDLKPTNVLVTLDQGEPIPKIIDFGLARATDHRLVAATLYTERGMVVGTPEYMSPEQAQMSSQDVDTRTDVYSLGVMLYELLTGQLPFSPQKLRRAGLQEIHRMIRDDDPPKPSTRLRDRNPAATRAAERRRTSVATLERRLRGDLDWIIGKAMEKDRNRRYDTAAALAEDIGRHLGHEPVLARPPRATYLLRKLGRRYRAQLVSAGLVLAVLVAGLVGMWMLWREAEAQSAEALRQQRIAQQHAHSAEEARAREAQKGQEARDNAARALSALNDYRRLEATAKLEALRAEGAKLPPPWPDHVATLRAWLERAEALMQSRADIEVTVAALRNRALPVADPEQERRSHPNYMQWVAVTQRLASLRRAEAVRQGTMPIEIPELSPAERDASPLALLQMAWPRVSVFHWSDRVFGDEARGLALAQLALEKLRDADATQRARGHVTLACAWFANGSDDSAKAEIARTEETGQASAHESTLRWLREGLGREVTPTGIGHLAVVSVAEADEQALNARISARRHWSFADPTDAAVLSTLTRFLQELHAFETGLAVRVRRHLTWAEQVEDLSVRRHDDRWQQARRAVQRADGVVASSLYAAVPIDLTPQIGLVPIGMNPATKLWEFYDLRSAWDPTGVVEPAAVAIPHHGSEGRIEVTPDSGLVFVLVPGGSFMMGAQRLDPAAPNHDPEAHPNEGPVHRVELAPFFLSRYEATQAQWARWTQKRPSSFNPPRGALTHPVENIERDLCLEELTQQGLTLPTEAQWEYACRAGRSTPWSMAAPATLDNCAKLRPRDGTFTVSIPVGSLQPNDFGLHDVHGNVREWVLDRATSYIVPPGPGDGRRYGWGAWLARGGCWNSQPAACRSSARLVHDEGAAMRGPDHRVNVGVRPSRPIQPGR